ncbi:MAG TPA: ubiquinol-cytochrome c reductase iron-sulfur subunit [Polyangia bacterium]|nr:ubiquinol-cytochrome c reductase iron-sulfur subunit [Polyangia bacterium]
MEAKASDTRRGFVARVTAALSGLAGAAALVPGLGLLIAPLRKATVRAPGRPVRVATEHDVRPDKPVRVTAVGDSQDAWVRLDRVTLGSCWLVRAREGAPVRAFSTICPHLGCGIDYDAQARRFDCPCHGSTFDLDGRCLKGPAPRGLDELEVTIDAGEVRVLYQRFRTGTAGKEPLG